MPLEDPIIGYGLRDVHVAPLDNTDTPGTWVDLPIAQTLSWSEDEDFEELRGDDKLQASRGKGAQIAWDLEEGGISLAAYKVMAGGTITASGTTPALRRRFNKKSTDVRPWFQIRGQVITDGGGDLHCVIYKAKVTGSIEGEFADGSFEVTKMSGIGIGNADDDLYDWLDHETAIAVDDEDA